jgi:hypothetical protein
VSETLAGRSATTRAVRNFDLPLERMIVLENKERATARQVFAILGGRRINYHSFICHCPCGLHAYGDRSPSLSVRDGDRGRLLLHCFAGGNYDDVVASLRAKGLRP